MARSRRKQKETRLILVGVGLLVFALLTVIAVATFYYRGQQENPAVDAAGCPLDGARATHAVVIDGTDPIGEVTKRHLRDAIIRYAKSVPKFGELQIYVAGADAGTLLKPVFHRCNPGDPEQVNSITGNRDFAREDFETLYLAPLGRMLDTSLGFTPAPRSPIFEGLQAVSVAAFEAGAGNKPRGLLLASDLLQNSPQYSVYDGFDEATATEAARFYRAALDGVDVEILRIPRRKDVALQNDSRFNAFWLTWFAQSGARVRSIEPSQGMN